MKFEFKAWVGVGSDDDEDTTLEEAREYIEDLTRAVSRMDFPLSISIALDPTPEAER